MAARRAVFLDKDGTLIPDIPFNVNTDLIRLSDNAVEGLQLLQRMGFLFVIVSNQPGIAKKLFNHEDILEVGGRISVLLEEHTIMLSGFYYCPHDPSAMKSWTGLSCSCRKPKPGLLYTAAKELNIDLSSSWMIGDILHDIEAGNLAGCKTIMIDNGNETKWAVSDERTPDMLVPHINAAADYILEMSR